MKLLSFIAPLLLISGVGAQNTGKAAEVRDLSVRGDGDGVRIEVTLSSPVTPHVTLGTAPPRMVLELPNSVPAVRNQLITAKAGVVKSVRLSAKSGTTRVTIALRQACPYGLSADDNRVVLTISPAESTSGARRGAPLPAASAPVFGRLHGSRGTIPANTDQSPVSTAPSAQLPPLNFPARQAETGAANSSGKSLSSVPERNLPPAKASPNTITLQPSATAVVSSVGSSAASNATSSSEPALAIQQPNSDLHVAFRIKYVAEGIAYLEGGSNDGLSEGMKLLVRDSDPGTGRPLSASGAPIAELKVTSVALSSAVTDIHDPTRDVKTGDWAYLSPEDTATLVAQRSLSATRKYPAVVSFTAGDPLDEEAHAQVPRPPLPEINRARGRIGFDYSGIVSHGSGFSSNVGLMMRTDITRINGTYWNLSGYWRGRLSSRSSTGRPTIQDLINRTYHLELTYDNPNSRWVAGFGRLYLPWASSLDTIDGGYFGRKLSPTTTAGIFAGSTPDPTSWSYNPDRRIGGAFVNFEGGSFEGTRYTSTAGLGIAMLKSQIDRPFMFFENGLFYKRYVSIYHSLQADSPRGNAAAAPPGPGVSRSFLTLRLQPYSRLEFDFNHTYFRDIPTFDPQLLGTGLLDKYLFQGFSAGARVEVVKNIWLYSTLGRSSRTGDTKASLNQLYGLTVGRLPWTDIRADLHYSRFNSAFGGGSYESVSLSRNFHENLRWEVLAGRQSFASFTTHNSSHFVTGNFEAGLGPNYFIQSGYTWNRGALQNYDQWIFTFGYRFDSKSKHK